MKTQYKIGIVLIALLLIIQLPWFNPVENYNKVNPENSLSGTYEVPMDIQMILYASCNDCHSNSTDYPWYYHIQPVSWWMADHIEEAKKHLNFSEFAAYSPKEAAKKFHEIAEVMEEREMPLESYQWMHRKAQLTDEQYQRVTDWAKKMHQQLQAQINPAQQ